MKKFVFLAVLAAALCCVPAWGETYLWSNHFTWSRLAGGKSSYGGSEFTRLYLDIEDDDTVATEAHMSLTGTMTIAGGSYSFWNGTEDEPVSGKSVSFNLISTDMTLGEEYLAYQPVNDAGGLVTFYNAAETGMNGQRVTWEFPDMPELNGQGTVPNFLSTAQQLSSSAPYVEMTRSGGNYTGLRWRVVKPSNTEQALSVGTPSRVQVRVFNHDEKRLYSGKWQNFDADKTLEGTVTFDNAIPEADLCFVSVRFRPDRSIFACYTWNFDNSTENSDAGIASWGDLANAPLKIKEGKTATVTVTMKENFSPSERKRKGFIGDTNVLSASSEEKDRTVTLVLKGLKPGKTTIRLFYRQHDPESKINDTHYIVSTAREVWVTDEDGNVPGEGGSSSGGGGCDAGALTGGLALLLAIPMLRRRRG